MKTTTMIKWSPFSQKHKKYIKLALDNQMNVAEGAIRSGKTIDHCIIASIYLETCSDKIHLASGSTIGNAKLNIGVCNGFGLEALFRGRCHWGKFKGNEALFLNTQTGEKIVIFAGGGKADSYKKILGNSYGMWIATEINEHYDSEDSRTSFIKVAFGRQVAAIKPFVLWDLNPCYPKHKIYSDYIDKYKIEQVKGYQYEHFTINDNLSVSEERKEELLSKYTLGSIWYRRDILGERCMAEGLIYRQFAENEMQYYINKNDVPKLKHINMGVDFGGNKSAHAFVATALTDEMDILYVLKSKSLNATNTNVTFIVKEFEKFADSIELEFGAIDFIYADSAEQAIINEMRGTKYNRAIANSIKNEIIDRIRCVDVLLSTGRIKLIENGNEDLADGLRNAVWDMNEKSDKRLDNGTSNIDILDAFEYSFERFIALLLRRGN